jgi:hypothetical protein
MEACFQNGLKKDFTLPSKIDKKFCHFAAQPLQRASH